MKGGRSSSGILVWRNELALGIETMDTQHRQIVAAAASVQLASRNSGDHREIGRALANLQEATKEHFRWEEALMLESGYGKYPDHKAEHDDLKARLFEIARDLMSRRVVPGHALELLVENWTVQHILFADKPLADFLRSKGHGTAAAMPSPPAGPSDAGGASTLPAGRRLRELLARRELLVAPGVYDGLTAKLVRAAGFPCMYMSGYCTAAARFGLPDLGLTTLTEMVSNVRVLSHAASLPLIADGDTGYGNALNVMRTVREYETAGAAALHIEDQVWPKRCGHMANKQLISKDEMAGKIRAAVDARATADFVIIARTDAIAVEGLESALDRLSAYVEAGADVVFADGQLTIEHLEAVPRRFPSVPSMVNLGPLTPPLSVAELRGLGYAIAIYPSLCIGPAVLAIQETLQRFKGTGTPLFTQPEKLAQLWTDLNQLLGVPQYNAIQEKYRS